MRTTHLSPAQILKFLPRQRLAEICSKTIRDGRVAYGGRFMSVDSTYRGIFFAVRNLGVRRWKWEIDPPKSVKGLYPAAGELDGELADAVVAAKQAIEVQTEQYTL